MFVLISGWRNWLGKHSFVIWNLAPLCLLWAIWRERNRHTFEDGETLVVYLKSSLVKTL